MQEVPPPCGGSIAKKEFASHPLARVASRVPPLPGLVPQFPDSRNRLSGWRSDKRRQNHLALTPRSVGSVRSIEQALAASQPGQQVVPATRHSTRSQFAATSAASTTLHRGLMTERCFHEVL